ncbi:MAG: T9SS type A sorting domain-containing protein, partial [Bacteroidales bacterium]|nr:T9SS type A sorting domain-containing protein [Bacteroidales bacterium]
IDYLFPTYFLEYEVNCGEDIAETEQASSLDLYPNPVQDKLHIEAEAEIEEVVVYDVYGRRQVTETPSYQGNLSVDVSDLNSGVYFVQIKTVECNITKRFVKE